MVGSLESTGIMHNKTTILGRGMFQFDTCPTACGAGDMLNKALTLGTLLVDNRTIYHARNTKHFVYQCGFTDTGLK